MGMGTAAAFAAFEAALDRALGARLRSDEAACRELWSALSNTEWRHADGSKVGYTFRRASEIVSTIRGEGHGLERHCSGPDGVVGREIDAAMAREGWTHGPAMD